MTTEQEIIELKFKALASASISNEFAAVTRDSMHAMPEPLTAHELAEAMKSPEAIAQRLK